MVIILEILKVLLENFGLTQLSEELDLKSKVLLELCSNCIFKFVRKNELDDAEIVDDHQLEANEPQKMSNSEAKSVHSSSDQYEEDTPKKDG